METKKHSLCISRCSMFDKIYKLYPSKVSVSPRWRIFLIQALHNKRHIELKQQTIQLHSSTTYKTQSFTFCLKFSLYSVTHWGTEWLSQCHMSDLLRTEFLSCSVIIELNIIKYFIFKDFNWFDDRKFERLDKITKLHFSQNFNQHSCFPQQ